MTKNIFTSTGGRVQYIPGKVRSNITPYEYTNEDQIKQLALQRDLTAANLLENDIVLDALDAAIDDQMKNFALTVPELAKSAQSLCGSPTVTWECYKKAKELIQIAPWITNGFDPVQLTFTDAFIPRAGNVVMNCQSYDPNTFPDPAAGIDAALGTTDDATQSPNTILANAQDNQKKWALLILFWDLLWGKPGVRPNIVDNTTANQQDISDINNKIQSLQTQAQDPTLTDAQRAAAKQQEAVLTDSITTKGNLPNVIMKDRPTVWTDLQWQGTSGPIDNMLKSGGTDAYVNPSDSGPWVSDAIAIWLDFGSIWFGPNDHYKDKSIPIINSGFILPILIGICSLVPKIGFFIIEGRQKLLSTIKGFKKVPIVGSLVYNGVKLMVNFMAAAPIAFNAIFIELCIFLAMHPIEYMPNVSDAVPLPSIKLPTTISLDVSPTPAGFVSMDCLTAAQDIVTRVNQEAVNG